MNRCPHMLITQSLQDGISTVEIATVRQAALMLGLSMRRARIDELPGYARELKQGEALPVGSVEFVREAMALAGIAEPGECSYPQALHHYLGRSVRKTRAGLVLGTWFVKPADRVKEFTGFVFDTLRGPQAYSPADRESYEAFMALPPEREVWTSEVVRFEAEWRYYFEGTTLLGKARYDDNPQEITAPQDDIVLQAAADLVRQWETIQTAAQRAACPAACRTYALDMGVVDGGTVLVEFNDAWAIGLYGRCLAPRQYLGFLTARWSGLLAERDHRGCPDQTLELGPVGPANPQISRVTP